MDADYIGEKIRRWRQFKGVKQIELANRLGIARSTLSKIENRKAQPTFVLVSRVSFYLELDLRTFLT